MEGGKIEIAAARCKGTPDLMEPLFPSVTNARDSGTAALDGLLRLTRRIVIISLTVLAAKATAQSSSIPPVITTQPQSRTARIGDYLMLTASAAGTPPLTYQWRFNETNVPDAAGTILPLKSIGSNQIGAYSVVVNNNNGSVTSAVAILSVLAADLPWGFTLIHSFTGGLDGQAPYSSLLQVADSSFYGTTTTGGEYGYGTIFRIGTEGRFTTVYSFSGGADGGAPAAGLISARDGNFYGTTVFGGLNGQGTVFRLNGGVGLTTLHSFTGSDGGYPVSGLIEGGDGILYGATAGRDLTGIGTTRGTVFKITTDGVFTNLYSFPSFGIGIRTPIGNLIQIRDGSIYGTASGFILGPTFSVFRPDVEQVKQSGVFKLTTNGDFTIIHLFNGLDGYAPESGLLAGADGNIYGTTKEGGLRGSGAVVGVDSNGVSTPLYEFSANYDGLSPEAGLLLGADGNYYGTTTAAGVSSVDGLSGVFQQMWAGTVFRLTTNGVLTTLYAFTTTNDGAVPASALIQGSDGNFYGTTTGYYFGGITASPGTVFALVPPGKPPRFLAPPYSQIAPPGGNPTFAAIVLGSSPILYQWLFNGKAVPGATNATLTLTNFVASLGGGYSLVANNYVGGTTSSVARLPFFDVAFSLRPNNAAPMLILGDISGSNYRIDVSSDLSSSNNWTPLAELTLSNSPVFLTDPSGPISTNRFYRAVFLP